jgi:class 3 adenylate cyclase
VVSVLFADLVGFTALSDDRDPESIREFLDGYFALARERIGRYGGSIEKFIGDAVMAVWGTPVAHEDDAERAVRAALDLVDAVSGLTAPDGSSVQVRAGVLTGEAAVAVGAQGQGMVAGDLVNTASRLQSVAPAGAVLVGEATVRASESAIVYEAAGDATLKGKATPVPAWRALRVVAGRMGAGRSGRLEPPFVGRDDELRLLKELFHATVREKRARLVSVTGIAGIGKSRLVWELEKHIDGLVETVYWHQGRSPAYGEGIAFWALAEMVRGRARIVEGDEPEAAAAKLRATLEQHIRDAEERAWVEPRLAGLIGLGPTPPGGTEELYAAWRTLFERLADEGPTVLVFEDLHWADPGLIDFIEALHGGARSRPVLIVTLARPELFERRPTWGAGRRNFTALDLGPLGAEDVEFLLVGLVPGLPQSAIRAIRDRAEGVPLYAVETVRMLLDQGRLSESDGRYRLVGELGRLAVPGTLTGLIGARVDGLDDAERALLGQAAVLGQSFTEAVLATVSGVSPAELRPVLDGLVQAELLDLDEDPRSAERGQYRFVQGLMREVLYGRLSKRERLTRHLAAAAYFAGRGEDDVLEVVANHRLAAVRLGEDGPDAESLGAAARAALVQAAERAVALHANARAMGYFDDAAALAPDEDLRMAIRERAADVAMDGAVGGPARERLAREVLAWHVSRGDRAGIARSFTRLGAVLLFEGRPHDATAELAAGLASLDQASEEPEVVRLGAELARAYLMAAEPDGVVEIVDRILPLAERLDLRQAIAELLVTKAWAISVQGRLQEATALLRGALEFAERNGYTNAEFRARMNLSALTMVEDPHEMMEIAWAGVASARRLGYDTWASALMGNATELSILLGEWDSIERELSAQAEVEGEPSFWAAQPIGLAAILAAYRGDDAAAVESLRRVREFAGDTRDPQIIATVRIMAARIDLAGGRFDDAVDALDKVVDAHLPGEFTAIAALLKGRVGVIRRDPSLIAAAAEIMDTQVPPGRWIQAELRALRATLDALAGRPVEALAGFDRAAAVLRELGVAFQLALVLLDRAELMPDDPGADAARAEGRAFLEHLGARAFLPAGGASPAGRPEPAQGELDSGAGQGPGALAGTRAAARATGPESVPEVEEPA